MKTLKKIFYCNKFERIKKTQISGIPISDGVIFDRPSSSSWSSKFFLHFCRPNTRALCTQVATPGLRPSVAPGLRPRFARKHPMEQKTPMRQLDPDLFFFFLFFNQIPKRKVIGLRPRKTKPNNSTIKKVFTFPITARLAFPENKI